MGNFHREVDVFFSEFTLWKETDAELVRPYNSVLIKRMVLSEKHFGVKVKDLIAKVMIPHFIAPVKLGSLDLKWIRNAFQILHVVEFDIGVLLTRFWAHVHVCRLAVEVVFLDHVHCIVVAACQNIHVIGVLAVLPCTLWRYLQIELIKDTLRVVCLLELHIGVKVMLHSQILHEVLRFPKIPHFDIQIIATRQQWWPRMLNEASACNWVNYLWVCILKWFVVSYNALNGSLHFGALPEIVDLHVALWRRDQELTWLIRVELGMCDNLWQLKNFLWGFVYQLVVHFTAVV